MGVTGVGRERVRGRDAAREARGETVACPNCGATLAARFCPRCGQERRDPADLTVGRVVGDAAREFVDLETGALATLRDLLLRPGYLPAEYIAGRRQAHVGPAKLYVLVSFVFFLFAWDRLMASGGFWDNFAPGGALHPLMVRRGVDPAAYQERFAAAFADAATWLRFGSVLLSGVLLKALYLGTGRLFAEHLIVSFYSFACDFSINIAYALVVLAAAAAGSAPAAWMPWLTYLFYVPYNYCALRRVYGESAGRTAAKTVAFTLGQVAIYFGVLAVAVILALRLA